MTCRTILWNFAQMLRMMFLTRKNRCARFQMACSPQIQDGAQDGVIQISSHLLHNFTKYFKSHNFRFPQVDWLEYINTAIASYFTLWRFNMASNMASKCNKIIIFLHFLLSNRYKVIKISTIIYILSSHSGTFFMGCVQFSCLTFGIIFFVIHLA